MDFNESFHDAFLAQRVEDDLNLCASEYFYSENRKRKGAALSTVPVPSGSWVFQLGALVRAYGPGLLQIATILFNRGTTTLPSLKDFIAAANEVLNGPATHVVPGQVIPVQNG